jgi:hypothetical protein
METIYKLEEADYFLERLKSLTKNPTKYGDMDYIDKEFMHNLSAFISAWRSVIDYLLYDYAEKFLGINREKRLDSSVFERVATECKNQKALEFVEWYKEKFGILEKDPLWKKRPYSIHRGHPKMSRQYRPLDKISGSITSSSIGPTKEIWVKPAGYTPPNQEMTIAYFFNDSEDKEVTTICEEALGRIKQVVAEALKKI